MAKCPTRRFGRTEIQMPILTCGGMRLQQSWAGAIPAPRLRSLAQPFGAALAPRLRSTAILTLAAAARRRRVARTGGPCGRGVPAQLRRHHQALDGARHQPLRDCAWVRLLRAAVRHRAQEVHGRGPLQARGLRPPDQGVADACAAALAWPVCFLGSSDV